MQLSLKFWLGSQRWPRDTASHVFLARAVNAIGRAVVENWTGLEAVAEPPTGIATYLGDNGRHLLLPIPEYENGFVRTKTLRTLHGLLAKHRPELALENLSIQRKVFPDLTPEQEHAVAEIVHSLDQSRVAARSRLQTVVRSLHDLFASGGLLTSLRPVVGGPIGPALDPSMWNTERVEARFYQCQMSLRDPFGAGVIGDGYQYIFVDRAGLDAFLRLFEPKPVLDAVADAAEHGRVAFRKWLKTEIEASPSERSLRKTDIKLKGAEMGVSARDGLNIKASILSNMSADVRKVWSKGGAPKKK